jgi:hypothetical protein
MDSFPRRAENTSPHKSLTEFLHPLIINAGDEARLNFSVLELEEKFGTLSFLFQ